MDREKLFEEFIKECETQKPRMQFCGQGNPNKDILIVGKESTAVRDNLILDNIKLCKDKRLRDAPREIDSTNDTWGNYQQLCDLVYCRKSNYSTMWDFEKECAFTTELNNNPSKKALIPNKKTRISIAERLELFKKSKFIQSFPVVVLACSNYIINKDDNRQIDCTFGVTYDGDEKGKYYYSPFNWFYTHHNEDKSKLVIHTRQLSQNVMCQMMVDMAKVIRDHLGINC